MEKINIRDRIGLIVLSVVFIALSIVVLSNKVNLHGDEVFTYGLSNHPYIHTFNIKAEEGIVYTPADTLWNEYMQVQEGHQFDYRNVWKNQEADVHPPLYYVLVHTISSFFPGQYSIWFTGSVNILFGVLLIVSVFFLALEILEDKKFAFCTAAFFAFSAGILSAVSYLRMYVMMMFWVCLITYLIVRSFRTGQTRKFYQWSYMISLLGALTHYYFLIYLFLLCCVFLFFLLREKKYRDVFKFCLTMLASGVSAIAVFPYMLQHIFYGQRGTEAVSNLTAGSLSEYIGQLMSFLGYINDQLFGRLLIVLLFMFAVAVIVGRKRGRKVSFSKKVILLLIPCVCYHILIARIAAYVSDRYIQPIYPIVAVIAGYMLCVCCRSIISGKHAVAVMAGAEAAVIAASLYFCQWPYLYRESVALLQRAEELSEYTCVYIYDGSWKGWKVQPSFYEVRNYQSVVFVSQEHIGLLDTMNLNNEEGVVTCMFNTCNQDIIFDKMESIYGKGTEMEKIGNYSYTTSYVIEKKE